MAVVRTEEGKVEGLITLEDIVETLLGLEIVDESDAAVDMRALAQERWKRRASRLGLETPEPEDTGTKP